MSTPFGPVVRHIVLISAATIALAMAAPAFAQGSDDLAKQAQNPIANLVSVPLQTNWSFGIGDRDETSALVNFQPVMPFAVSGSTNVILRVIVPLTSQPGPSGTRIGGMGDVLMSAFFSPSAARTLIWGVGPAVLLPSATNNALGAEKFGIGPTVVLLTQPGKWTLGCLANQIFSTSGTTDRPDVNQTYVQPFMSYDLGRGLSVGASMEAAGNWEADEVWTAPLLFQVTKVTRLAQQPVSLGVSAGPMVASPDGGAAWRFRMSVNFLFPR